MTRHMRDGTDPPRMPSTLARAALGSVINPTSATSQATWANVVAPKQGIRQKILTNPAEGCFGTRCAAARIIGPASHSHAAGGRPRRRRMEQPQATEVDYTLAKVAIFARLPSKALEALHQTCRWRHYKPGNSIVDYLDASDEVFFVTKGEVCVTIYSVAGKAVSFRNLGPGAIFGEYAAIDGDPRCASVVAKSECLIASLPAPAFRRLLRTEPVVGQALIRELVSNVRTLTKRIYEFSTLAVNNRIQAELLRLASLAPRQGKSARLVPPPTHAEIASRVSTHREAVTRELNRLSHLGLIERQHGMLIVWDVDRLAEMLHEMTGE